MRRRLGVGRRRRSGDPTSTTPPRRPPGELVASYELRDSTWYTATATSTGYRLQFTNCGEFVISADLARVVVRKDPSGSRPNLLPILLAGTVSSFLLALGGATVLHASAVAIDGAALAFVGQSGRGKTTVAALMCVDGAALVADDLVTVDIGPPVTCTGGAVELRLRAAAASIADARPDATTRVTADERSALSLTAAPLGPLPLAAIVVPAPVAHGVRGGDHAGFRRATRCSPCWRSRACTAGAAATCSPETSPR